MPVDPIHHRNRIRQTGRQARNRRLFEHLAGDVKGIEQGRNAGQTNEEWKGENGVSRQRKWRSRLLEIP